MKLRFVIPGKPRGYVATTKAGKWSKEYERFREYAKFVRQCARLEGIKLPLVATKDKPLIIKTIAYFKDGVHCDPGNVQKGVCDILFYDEDKYIPRGRGRGKGTRKGDDKYTGGEFPAPLYDKANPRVEVEISEYLSKPESSKGLDLIGKTFGNWEVIEYDGIKNRKSFWICVCVCGEERSIIGKDLTGGKSNSCGSRPCKGKDLGGKVFGHWTVIGIDESSKVISKWICRCGCGTERSVITFHLVHGKSKSCGCHGMPYGESNWNELYRAYKRGAKDRGCSFNLTKKMLRELASSPCEYCGLKPSSKKYQKNNKQPIMYNGIDRVDNDVGYEVDNCVTCCSACNTAKNNMTIRQFNRWRVRMARVTRLTIKLGDKARVPIKLKKRKRIVLPSQPEEEKKP